MPIESNFANYNAQKIQSAVKSLKMESNKQTTKLPCSNLNNKRPMAFDHHKHIMNVPNKNMFIVINSHNFRSNWVKINQFTRLTLCMTGQEFVNCLFLKVINNTISGISVLIFLCYLRFPKFNVRAIKIVHIDTEIHH